VVTKTDASGAGSLAAAITTANSGGGAITFDPTLPPDHQHFRRATAGN
jgi:hypothetical protein